MSNQSLTINLQGQPAPAVNLDRVWVKLQQYKHSEVRQSVTLADLYNMITMARAGASAWYYAKDGCPVEIVDGVAIVTLDFYAFPSDPALPYSVDLAFGLLSDPQRVRLDKSFLVAINNTDRVELPFVMEEVTIEWRSPAFDSDWTQIHTPGIQVQGAHLVLTDPCIGFVRVSGKAIGDLFTATMFFQKYVEEEDEDGELNLTGYKIDGIRNSATAAWVDELGKSQAEICELEVPECVKAALAECPDGELKGDPTDEDGKTRLYVFVSQCTGKIIQVGKKGDASKEITLG